MLRVFETSNWIFNTMCVKRIIIEETNFEFKCKLKQKYGVLPRENYRSLGDMC